MILHKTKCYLIGSMQYENGEAWREEAERRLHAMGVITFNPYKSPFINGPEENEETHANWRKALEEGRFEEVHEDFSEIRNADLSLVDRSDFLICYLKTSVFTAGTIEELSWAVRLKRPVFIVIEGGKEKVPFWVLGMVPAKYIYSSFEEVYSLLEKIHTGEREIDYKRWRLLRPELR
jgi:nucleoside 2-deoxyribosyltransferase